MHENTQIAHQPQAKPAALDNMNVPVPELSDLEPGLNQWLPIQLKLSVGAPDDPLEYEADAMADKVMRMPETSFIQRKSACSCSDYDDEHVRLKPLASQVTPFIQAKGDGAGAVSDSVSNRIQSSMGGGQQLDGGTKSFMESRFGADFSDVKIHNGGESAELNQSLNAKAFTVSNNIYFNSGQYQPQTDSGKHLLAHELTHVVQQGGEQLYKKDLISQPLIQKQTFDINNIQRQIDLPAEDLDVLNHPIDGVVKASIFQGLVFYPSNSKATYKPGSVKYLQGLAATVKALTGEKYSPDLVTDFIEISTGDNELIKYGGGDKAAKENEPFKPNSLIEGVPLRLINFLLGKNIKLKLSSDQIDIIQAYVTTDQIYEAIKETAPKWFTRNILALLMLNKKTWLSKYASLKRNEDLTGNLDKETSSDYYIKIEQYVFFYIDIIEAVRTDSQLVENPSYRIMWKLQSDKPGAKIQLHSEIAGPNNEIDFLVAAEFIQQCNTDISDAKKAIKGDEEGHKARQRLLKDTISTSVFNGSKKADTTLSDKLNRYNAPPLPSSLQCFPPLGPPLFELVANTSPTFLMSVEWGDIYEALGFAFAGSYGFELIRINDDVIKDLKKMKEGDVSDETAAKGRAQNEEVKNIAEDPKVKGENPGVGGVITQKLHQRVDYFAEDVDTVFGGISAKLGGDPGVGTLALDAVGSVFGAIGDVISSFWQKINAPRGERKIPIDKPGLYVIRAIAFQADISETASFVRAPSVAWMPVWARSAEDMAAKYGDQLEAGREVSASKLQDVNKELLQPNLDPERKKGLQKTKEALTVFLYGSAKETLDLQKRELEEALLVSKTPEEKESIKDQLKETNRIIETEKKRLDENKSSDTSLESPFEMTAVFISDDGSSRQILFELIEKPKDGSDFQYFVSDLSSSKSSSETGPLKNTREDAIQSAIEEYLDEPSRYGRGYCSIYIPPRIGSKGAAVKNTFRVKSDAQAIVLDSVENIASALSVILIAAAPFTGGASLALMLPIGIIGAIPSAYRLYDRAQGDSFHLDYGTAMDLVNVVTSFTGLGGEVAGKLKWVTVGKGFAIVGLGMNGLGFIVGGAQTLDEIDNISKRTDLSPGTRKAMIMSAIGGQLQAAGLMVGAHLVESSKALRESNELEAKNAADSAKPAKTKGTNDVDAAKPARDTVPAMPHSDETVTPAKPHATTKDTLPIEEPANVPKIEKKTPVPKTPKPTDETKANQPEHKPGEPEVKGKQKVSENDPEIIDLPAGSVMKGADPHNAVETAQMYRRSINDSPKREAAIYHNPTTNEFIVIQGDEGAAYVEGPGGTQEGPAPAGTVQKWKEILDGNDTGSWELTAHYHPGESGGFIDPVGRLPSGAGGDFSALIGESEQAGGKDRSSKIDFKTPRGNEFTFFSYDPAEAKPFKIDYPDPKTLKRTKLEFSNLQEYHDWMKANYNVDLGPVSTSPKTSANQTGANTTRPAAPKDKGDREKVTDKPVSPDATKANEPAAVKKGLLRSNSKNSLLQFLDRIWNNREAIRKKYKGIYDFYSETTEPNRRSKTVQEYNGELDRVIKGKNPDTFYYQQGDFENGFSHFYRGRDRAATERIYLNVKADNAPGVMQRLLNEVIQNPGEFPGVIGGKISGSRVIADRPDGIVLYLKDSAAAGKVLAYIENLRSANPSLFMETTPPMTQQVGSGVSVANEPVQTPGAKPMSFGQSRIKAIQEALDNVMNRNGTKEAFIKEVDQRMSDQGIDPDNPYLNKPDKDK